MQVLSLTSLFAVASITAQPAKADAQQNSTFVVRHGEAIPIEVDGVKGGAAVDPGENRGLSLSPRFATRQDLGRSRCKTGAVFGPIEIPGVCKEAWISMAGQRFRRNVSWFAAFPVVNTDVIMGLADLPHRIVRIELRPAVPGEQAFSLPLTDFGNNGMGVLLTLDRRPVRVLFGLKRKQPLATAPAGTVIAAAQGGRLEGQPRPMLIDLGVERPVQVMRLDRPLIVGPLSIDTLRVRVADYGRTRIAEARSMDPDELVVTGTSLRDRSRDWISLGTDALESCSSLTFDKPRMIVTLRCAGRNPS